MNFRPLFLTLLAAAMPAAHAATVTWDQTGGFTPLTNFVSQGEWNTAGNTEGWGANNTGSASVSGGTYGGLSGSPAGNPAAVDPHIFITPTLPLDITTGDHNIIEFALRIGDGVASFDPIRLDLFWGTSLTPGFAGARRIQIDGTSLAGWNAPAGSAADGVSHVYQVDMSGTAGWDGTLTHLRLDPIAGTVAGGQANQEFAFDYVRISTIPEPGAAALGLLGALGLVARRRR